jgi:Domain of unknown function (DUF4390)
VKSALLLIANTAIALLSSQKSARQWFASIFYIALVAIAQLNWAVSVVYAETIPVKSALVRLSDEAYVVDAEFDLTLTPAFEAALLRGTPLYFVLDSEMTRSRSFWFDQEITTQPSTRRITYVPLTSSYRVDSGGTLSGGGSYATLDEALRQIRVIRGRPLVDKKNVRAGERYEVSLRLRLDTAQLPKPLQVNTLVSREWSLVSDWYRVVLTP